MSDGDVKSSTVVARALAARLRAAGHRPKVDIVSAELNDVPELALPAPKRSVLPPDPPQPVQQLQSVDALVGPGESIVLAQWVGPPQGTPVTVYASRAENQVATIALTQDVQVLIEVMHGGVRRTFTWPWPNVGFCRRFAAQQVKVTAINQSTGTTYRLGASVQAGDMPRDRFTTVLADPAPGVLSDKQFFPTWSTLFRAVTSYGGGTLSFAQEVAPGVLTSFEGPFPVAQFADWTPVPPFYAGLVFDGTATDAVCYLEWET